MFVSLYGKIQVRESLYSCIFSAVFGLKLNIHVIMFSPIQDGGGVKNAPPTSFSPLASTVVEISPQNLLTFSFNLFATLV